MNRHFILSMCLRLNILDAKIEQDYCRPQSKIWMILNSDGGPQVSSSAQPFTVNPIFNNFVDVLVPMMHKDKVYLYITMVTFGKNPNEIVPCGRARVNIKTLQLDGNTRFSVQIPLAADTTKILGKVHFTGQVMSQQIGMPQQPMMGGMPQQPMMGGMPQQPMMGGMPQQPMMGGMPQQPMMGGMPQQPMMGGMPQQPMMGGMPQQPMMGGMQQPMSSGGIQPPNSSPYSSFEKNPYDNL